MLRKQRSYPRGVYIVHARFAPWQFWCKSYQCFHVNTTYSPWIAFKIIFSSPSSTCSLSYHLNVDHLLYPGTRLILSHLDSVGLVSKNPWAQLYCHQCLIFGLSHVPLNYRHDLKKKRSKEIRMQTCPIQNTSIISSLLNKQLISH